MSYHNTLVDIIFVSTVNIPNLRLLPCPEVAEWSIARALKWSIFIAQMLALHKKGIEFCQQFNGAIRTKQV